MGLLKILEHIGVVSVEDASADPTTVVAAPTSAPVVGQTSSVAPPAPATEDAERNTAIDKGARDILLAAIEKANVQTVEELGDMLDTLRDAIPDERTLYTKAISVLSKKGVTSHQILGDYDTCIGALEAAARSFEENQKSQEAGRIGVRQRAIEEAQTSIQQKRALIQTLQAEVDALDQKAKADASSIAGEQSKIAQVSIRFGLVYKTIRGEVESQRNKVTTYGAVQ